MMTKNRRDVIVPALLFTLYMFIFLLTELTVNARCEIALGRQYVTAVYSVDIICTAIGYLGFYFSRRLCKSEGKRKLFIFLFIAVYLAATLCFMFTSSAPFFTTSALISLLAFGYIGGFTHYTVSLFLFGKVYSGKVIGSAVAAAVLLQFAVQKLFITDIALLVSLVLGAAGIIYLAVRPVKDWMFENPLPYAKKPSVSWKDLIMPALIVAVMSLCFGLGDGVITKLHAQGTLDLAAAPRLLYALGVIAAGIVADIKGRRFLPLCTLCLLVVTSVTSLFIGDGNTSTNNIYVCVMYMFSGFYIMYLTVTFIDIAPKTDKPDLWAGMGRIIRGVFIAAAALLSNALFADAGQQGIAVVSVCLSVIVLVLLVISGGLNIQTAKKEPPKDRMLDFLKQYKLTPRESEVLEKLIEGDDTNKDIAAELFISTRMLERYISSIYEKTDTRTRIGLLKLYYEN